MIGQIQNYTDLAIAFSNPNVGNNSNIPPWMQFGTPSDENTYVSAVKGEIPELQLTLAKEIHTMQTTNCPNFAPNFTAAGKVGFQLANKIQNPNFTNGKTVSVDGGQTCPLSNPGNILGCNAHGRYKQSQVVLDKNANALVNANKFAKTVWHKRSHSQKFDPISTLSLATYGSNNANPDLLKLPTCANSASSQSAKMQSGLRGRTAYGPIRNSDMLRDPVFTNGLSSPSLLSEYMKQNGYSANDGLDEYNPPVTKQNFMKIKMSGANYPVYGTNYSCGSCMSAPSPSCPKQSSAMVGAMKPTVAANKKRPPTGLMYSQKRIKLMDDTAFRGYTDAISEIGIPNMQSVLLARYLQNHVQKTQPRPLMSGRQRQGDYINTPAFYPSKPPPFQLFGNLPQYIPISSPDEAHGGFSNPFVTPRCSQGSAIQAQQRAIAATVRTPLVHNLMNKGGLRESLQKIRHKKNFSA